MKKFLLLFLIGAITSCSSDSKNDLKQYDGPISVNEIRFTAGDNSSLTTDVVLNYDGGDTFEGVLPYTADIHNLVADITVDFNGAKVFLNNETYQEGEEAFDFGKEVSLKVSNATGSASSEYTIRLTYFTGIPVVRINTSGVPIDSKEDYVPGEVEVYGGLNLNDLTTSTMKIKGRGNSTWWQGVTYGKKPYQIKFSESTGVLEIPGDEKWVLLAEWSDKTLLRNSITFQMGHMSDLDYTPTGELVEVILNGEPQGTYLMSQKVEVTPNRVNIGPEGYLVEIDNKDRLDPDDVYFTPEIFTSGSPDNVFNIKEPEIAFDSEPYLLIENHINDFESALFGADFKDPDTGYRAFIDVPSFVDWYLINEISKTQDARNFSSIYFNYIPGPGNKIKMGPLWDFDLSYGNVNYSDATYPEGFWIRYNPWYERLFQDPWFAQQVRDRFDFYYNNLDTILGKIDDYHTYINASQTHNYELWGTLGTYVWPNPVYFDTYDEEVGHLKQWITTRMNWMNAQL